MGALVTVGVALLFVPSREETALRLIEDGNVTRAAAVMAASPKVAPGPGGGGGAGTPAAPARAVVSPAEAMTLFILTLESGRAALLDDGEAAALVAPLADPVGAAGKLETLALPPAPEVRRRLLAALGDRLLALDRPGDAATLFGEARRLGDPGGSLADKQITALRWADQAAAALDLIELIRQDFPSDAARWHDLRFALLRETDRSGAVLEELLAALPADRLPSPAGLSLIVDCAAESGNTALPLPVMRRYLAADAAGRRFLGDSTPAAPPDPMLRQIARRYADYCAWNDGPADAFPAYAELARLGDSDALAQCLRLFDGLNEEETMAVLLLAQPLEALPQDVLALGVRLWTATGRVAAAESACRLELRRRPADAEAALKLADLLMGTSDYTAAAEVCRSTAALVPEDARLIRRLAQADLAEGRFEEALGGFARLAGRSDDPEAEETAACLAEALDRPIEQVAALKRKLSAVSNDAATVDALALALSGAGRPREAVDVLKEFGGPAPASAARALALAHAAMDARDPGTAVAALARPAFARNREAVECLLDAAGDASVAPAVAEFLRKNDAARALAIDSGLEAFRLSLIVADGDPSAAGVDWRNSASDSVDPGNDAADRLRTEADTAFAHSDYAGARRAMQEYLSRRPHAPAEDWSYLGTICKAQGDGAASRVAFQRFLQRLADRGRGRTPPSAAE